MVDETIEIHIISLRVTVTSNYCSKSFKFKLNVGYYTGRKLNTWGGQIRMCKLVKRRVTTGLGPTCRVLSIGLTAPNHVVRRDIDNIELLFFLQLHVLTYYNGSSTLSLVSKSPSRRQNVVVKAT